MRYKTVEQKIRGLLAIKYNPSYAHHCKLSKEYNIFTDKTGWHVESHGVEPEYLGKNWEEVKRNLTIS